MSLFIALMALIISLVALINAIANYVWLREWLDANGFNEPDEPDEPDEFGPPDLTEFEKGIADLLDDDQPGNE